jgi:threonine dehydrogenase-like Zn-dependent dehydrogenase
MNKGLTVRTGQQHGQKFLPRLLDHAVKGELDASLLATHRFSLEDSPKGYDMFKTKEDGLLRAVFVPA